MASSGNSEVRDCNTIDDDDDDSKNGKQDGNIRSKSIWDELVPAADMSAESTSQSVSGSNKRPFSQGAVDDFSVETTQSKDIDVSGSASDPEKNPFRRSRTLPFRRRKKSDKSNKNNKEGQKKRKNFWTSFRIKKKLPASMVKFKKGKDHGLPEPSKTPETNTCVCTGYRRTKDHVLGPGVVFSAGGATGGATSLPAPPSTLATNDPLSEEMVDWLKKTVEIHEVQELPPPKELLDELAARNLDITDLGDSFNDIDEIRMLLRRRDIETGIEVSESQIGYKFRGGSPRHSRKSNGEGANGNAIADLAACIRSKCTIGPPSNTNPVNDSFDETSNKLLTRPVWTGIIPRTIHTQVDYIHCLVPDLLTITNCSFYWGVMDRYEAEKLLESRPEGTFLLRDSAQEEFLFSVSFRRYGRSLHARIEQWNHKFSFDSHDPGVYASDTVCGLIEHYKDPSCCMFFEPMLTRPLHRSFPFSLQHMCRAVICERSTYDGLNFLPLPKPVRQYLKYYHYKQKVRVRKFECQH